jgi:hypothetical protein
VFKKSVPMAHSTHCVSVKNTNWLNLRANIMTVLGIVRKADVHSLGKMRRLLMLKYVVRAVRTAL